MIIIVAGAVVIGLKSGRSQPIEISLNPAPAPEGEIYVTGAVSNPGIYPLEPGDTLEDVIRAAGGPDDNADLSRIKLSVPEIREIAEMQKVNINTADSWLLAALPGIGEVRAQAIIAYRQKNGLFRDINELLNVEGIGSVTLDNIRDLITVAD